MRNQVFQTARLAFFNQRKIFAGFRIFRILRSYLAEQLMSFIYVALFISCLSTFQKIFQLNALLTCRGARFFNLVQRLWMIHVQHENFGPDFNRFLILGGGKQVIPLFQQL